MTNTITIQSNNSGELVVDSRLIAEDLGVKHKNFLETLKKYQTHVEQEFGAVAFETREFKTSQGNQGIERFALLTEPQATVLMTFSRNTEKVIQCKLKLVKAFEIAKQQLKNPQPEPVPSPVPLRPARDSVEFINACATLDSLSASPHLKKLLEDFLIDDLSKARSATATLLPAGESKAIPEYTIAKVRARELGYSATDIGTGSGLGGFVAKRLNAEFSERVGKYTVKHYRVSPEFDAVIHEYFRRPRLIEG